MSLNPADFQIPEPYRHWAGDPAEDHIGPFFYYVDDQHSQTAFRPQQQHCNAYGIVHGGLLMAFADYTLCLAAIGEQEAACVTVSCNTDFAASARENDLILGQGIVIRRTRSLVFTRAELQVGDATILNASAVIKMLPNKA